ncbi:glycosyltransferase family 4 protein [Sphingomonas parva]|uniref:Glycosyltransferase family 4 protein n=1 Tax=Sphingomonas parva TaxID=2555898 RepID=A0A4Y8ZS76_9SPHN|nr:glycosyltransferase [Sphingomonas parva]TFI58774.1 glycosyltransferase family 4 protein [Sphingomonas parva]
MLRVLTLSTLFPDARRPTFGVFVERQTLGLAARADAAVEVVAGVGLPPWPLSLHPHYRDRRALPRKEEWNGLAVHRPRFRVGPGLAARSGRALAAAALPCLRRIRARFPFDVIDAEFLWPDGVAAMHLSRALGIPFSVKARGSDVHYWGTRPEVRGQIVEAAYAAGGLLAVSAALKADMAALGMPEDRILVHHTGVDLALFAPRDRTEAKAALGIDGPLIASVGALIPLKRQHLVIEALATLPGVHLILVGDGPERRRLETRAASLGVADRVRFLGNRPHAELPALLAAADVMVLPSEREGLANVWLESLACGTPVVITDVGGAREVIDRPEAGTLAAPNSADLANAIAALLAAPPAQERVRRSAERFGWEKNSDALFEHLSAVAAAT